MAGSSPQKPEVIAFNKVDAVSEEELDRKLADFKRRLRKVPHAHVGCCGQECRSDNEEAA